MKSLLFIAFLAGAVSTLQATCQQDFESCKTSYVRELPNTAGRPAALCNLANNYISCLRNLTDSALHPNCASMTDTINEARRKTETMLNQNATNCVLCTREVEKCQSDFQSSASQAANDISAVCNDGQNLILCLREVEKKTECMAEKPRLEQQRRKAEEKLNEAGCESGNSCLLGIEACETHEAASKSSATTHALECQVADTFYHCLVGQKCTGQYANALKRAIDQLVVEAKAGNCTFTNPTGGAVAQRFSVPVVVMLAMAVVALLK